MERHIAGGTLTLLQILIGIVDLSFCSLAMYILMPSEPPIDFVVVAVIFVSATLLGFASHSPGGLGVFDAAMLYGILHFDSKFEKEALLAGCCCFACCITSCLSSSLSSCCQPAKS